MLSMACLEVYDFVTYTLYCNFRGECQTLLVVTEFVPRARRAPMARTIRGQPPCWRWGWPGRENGLPAACQPPRWEGGSSGQPPAQAPPRAPPAAPRASRQPRARPRHGPAAPAAAPALR